MGGRGILTAAALIAIALASLVIARRIEHERRQLGHFPPHRKRLAVVGAIGMLLLAVAVAFALLRR
jgi:multisubunit Na+/H+ antiporter MnhB subunit